MFSLARRGLEKAELAKENLVLKEEGENEARVALLNALRRAERVLVNRDDDVDHRLPKEIVTEEDLAVSCNEETIRFLENCFNIDSGASGNYDDVSNWFRESILNPKK
jgi:hypothetical protein